MGKSLKGKELGTGISQLKNGQYTGRVTDKTGKRIQKYFKKLAECKKWVADMQYEIDHGNALYSENPTINVWYNYWFENVKVPNIKESTQYVLNSAWTHYILPIIGEIPIQNIKPMHCLNVLNNMSNNGYCKGTIKRVRTTMHDFFECALENNIVRANPVTRSVRTGGKEPKEIRVLTIQEQKDFLTRIQNTANYNFFALALQTGMRVGELLALTWDDIDFQKREISVNKTVTLSKEGKPQINTPKTENSKRKIPLNEEAIKILENQKIKNNQLKVINIKYKDHVFVNKNGNISSKVSYTRILEIYCKKYNVKKFSMHTLRHTFATRCIEAGLRPKTLQTILGHATLAITMDLYVHVTDEEKENEMLKVQDYLKIV